MYVISPLGKIRLEKKGLVQMFSLDIMASQLGMHRISGLPDIRPDIRPFLLSSIRPDIRFLVRDIRPDTRQARYRISGQI